MKLTLKQLEARCRALNKEMKDKPWVVLVERFKGTDVLLELVPRKPGQKREPLCTGSVHDIWIFLDGFMKGLATLKETTNDQKTVQANKRHDCRC